MLNDSSQTDPASLFNHKKPKRHCLQTLLALFVCLLTTETHLVGNSTRTNFSTKAQQTSAASYPPLYALPARTVVSDTSQTHLPSVIPNPRPAIQKLARCANGPARASLRTQDHPWLNLLFNDRSRVPHFSQTFFPQQPSKQALGSTHPKVQNGPQHDRKTSNGWAAFKKQEAKRVYDELLSHLYQTALPPHMSPQARAIDSPTTKKQLNHAKQRLSHKLLAVENTLIAQIRQQEEKKAANKKKTQALKKKLADLDTTLIEKSLFSPQGKKPSQTELKRRDRLNDRLETRLVHQTDQMPVKDTLDKIFFAAQDANINSTLANRLKSSIHYVAAPIGHALNGRPIAAGLSLVLGMGKLFNGIFNFGKRSLSNSFYPKQLIEGLHELPHALNAYYTGASLHCTKPYLVSDASRDKQEQARREKYRQETMSLLKSLNQLERQRQVLALQEEFSREIQHRQNLASSNWLKQKFAQLESHWRADVRTRAMNKVSAIQTSFLGKKLAVIDRPFVGQFATTYKMKHFDNQCIRKATADLPFQGTFRFIYRFVLRQPFFGTYPALPFDAPAGR
jgi:hypothetical protein